MIPYKRSAYKLLHNGSIALAEIEGNGIRIDTTYLKKITKQTEERIIRFQDELEKSKVGKLWRKVYKGKTNFNSNDQLGKILFEHVIKHMEIEAQLTATGRYKTDEKSLATIDHPFVSKYLKIKKLQKVLTTYLRGLQKEVVDEFIHPFFNLHIVKTFRSSSDSPNFQNIPVRDKEIGKLIRKAFIARKGNHLVEIDYGGIEVCIAAAYHKDSRMINYISNPKLDLHRDMAMECYQLNQSQITKDIRFYGKNCFVFPQFYGSIYIDCARNLWEAISTADLKTKNNIPLKQHLRSKGIKELGECDFNEKSRPNTFERHIQQIEKKFWEKRFKTYTQWKKKWFYKYLDRGWMLTKTGFICQGFMKRNEIINYPVQGSAFHCLLWSLIRLVKELRKHKMKSLVIGQIHDSILADVPAEELDDFLVLANNVMTTQLMETWKWINVPLTVEAEVCPVGGSWADKKEMEIPK